MVCLSSALLIRASQIAPAFAPAGDSPLTVVWDPNRLAAGVVTGIGFLGAAAVIRSGDIVRGITTGACVWAVAVLGVIIGHGAYALAISGAVAMLSVLVLFDRVLGWASPVVYRRMRVSFEGRRLSDLRDELKDALRDFGVVLQDVSGRTGHESQPLELELHLRCRNRLQAPEVIELVSGLEGVRSVEWTMLSA
jgi:putative Mg2+ transporter-C (MgtC) family protein